MSYPQRCPAQLRKRSFPLWKCYQWVHFESEKGKGQGNKQTRMIPAESRTSPLYFPFHGPFFFSFLFCFFSLRSPGWPGCH